jgi:hypothetical protein
MRHIFRFQLFLGVFNLTFELLNNPVSYSLFFIEIDETVNEFGWYLVEKVVTLASIGKISFFFDVRLQVEDDAHGFDDLFDIFERH